jgi:phosphate transport system protein
MRRSFDQQLQVLHDALLCMGTLVERSIQSAVASLIGRDLREAQFAIDNDPAIDRMENEIEGHCLMLILRHQPVARDLRLIAAVLKMTTDLERIGDQAADISGIVKKMGDEPFIKKLVHLPQMAESALEMLSMSLDAFVRGDAELARAAMPMDDHIDELFETIRKELIEILHKNGKDAEQALNLLMIAKYFERIGDHAQNIAEWAEFAVTGVYKGESLWSIM